ncbi:MAG: VanZ family protein [Butyrivibrio sp.]|nr:VanZ family protein [Butyrivibrio sp.]
MSAVYEMIIKICQDVLEPISYLPYGLFFGGMFLFLCLLLRKLFSKKMNFRQDVLISAFITYMTVLMIQAFFSREPGSRIGISLELFSVTGVSLGEDASFIENIIMFVPFGLILTMLIPAFKNGLYCIGLGFSFSVFLELLQLFTLRGYCQVDDVFANTVGVSLGWIIPGIYYLCTTRKSTKVYAVKSLF